MKPLPTISHLQFLVLDILGHAIGDVSATVLRKALSEYGDVRSGPKFYQLMRRMEEDRLLEVVHARFEIAGGEVGRTLYRRTGQGLEAWQAVLDFYLERGKI